MVDYERMLKILETQEKSQAEGQKEADTKRLFLEEPSSMADIAMQRRTIDLPPRLHSQRIQSKPMTDMRWSDINMNGTNNQPPAAISFRKTNTGGNNDGAIAPSSSSLSENTLSKHKSNSGVKELQKQDGEKSANIAVAAKAVKLVAASNQEYEDQNSVVFNADNRDVFERCRSDMSRDLWSKDPFEEETFPADEIKEGEGNDVIVKDVVITPAVRVLPLATEEVDKKPPQEEEEVVVEENKTQEVEVPMEDSMKILPEQQDATKVSKEQEVSTKNSVVAKPRGFGILKRKARMSNLRKKKKNDASKKTAPSNVAPSTTTNEDEKKGENKALNLRQRVRIRMLGVNSRQSKKTVVEKSATVVKADDASTKITDELKKQEPVQEVPSTPVKKQLSNDNPATPPSSSTLAAVIIANPSRGKELTFDNVKDGSNPVDTPTTTTSNVSTLNTPSSHAVSTATPNSEEVPSGFTPKTAAEEAVELEASPMLLPPAMPSAVTVKKEEEEEEETAEESMPDDTTVEEEEEPQGEDEQEDEAKAVDSMEELKETEKTITEDGQDADTVITEMVHNDGEDNESTSINRIVCNNDEHGVIDSSTDVLVDVSSAFQGEGDDIEVIKCMDIKDIESDILSVRESVRGNRDNNVNDNIPEEEEEEDDDEDIFEDLSSKNETSNATSNEETVPSLPSKENNEPTKSQSRGGRIVGRRIMKLKKNLVSAEAKSKNRQGSKNKGRRFSLKDKETSGVTDTAHLSSDAKDVVYSSPESANAMLLKEVIGKNKTACGLSPEAQAVLAGDDLAIDGIEVGSDKKQTGLSQKAKFILAAAETNEDMEEIEVLMESKRQITVSKKQKKQTQIRRSNTDKSYDSSYANSYESHDDDESLYNDSEEEEDGSFYGSEADDDDDSTCSFVSKASTRSDRSSNVFNFEPCGIPQEELVADLIDAFEDTKAHVQQIIEGLDFRDITNCTEVPVSKRENRRARRRRAAAALSENSKRKQRSSREISTDRRRSSSRVERKNGEMKTRRMEV